MSKFNEGIENAQEAIQQVMYKVLGDEAEAAKYSENPREYLVDHGVNDYDLSEVNLGDTVTGVANELNFSPQATQTLVDMPAPTPASAPAPAPAAASAPGGATAAPVSSGGGGGGGGYTAPPTVETVEQTINNYVTEVYETNDYITHNIEDYSKEYEFKVNGDVDGDIMVRDDSVNAYGDNAAAAGGSMQGVATGDAAVAAGKDITDSNIASGDGAVAFDGANKGNVNTGENSGIMADGSADGAVVGDGNTVNNVSGSGETTIGDGNVDSDIDIHGDGVVGDNNETMQGSDDSNATFGDGSNTTDFENATIGGGGGGGGEDGGDIQFGIGQGNSNATQDNDTTIDNSINESFNDESQEQTAVHDNSVNDSHNLDADTQIATDVDVDTTIEDSFDHEDNDVAEHSFNEDFDTTIDADHSHVDDVIDD